MATLMSGARRTLMGASALLLLASASCRPKAPAAPPAAAEAPWVARVNGEPITAADVQFEIKRRTDARRVVGDADAILQDLIQRKAMLGAASASGVLQEPEVRRELENRELGQWLDRTLQAERDRVKVSDEELRAHYDAQPDSFTRPEMVRLAVLFRKINPRDPQDAQAALRAELQKGRAAYLADPAAVTQHGRLAGFGTVAAQFSEDAISRYRGGDLGWIGVTEAGPRQPAEILAAGRNLAKGAVSDVIAAGEGFYVVLKIDQRAAERTPFEEVAPGLRRQLIRSKQESVEHSFVSNLMARARVEIDQGQVSRLVIPKPVAPEPPALHSAVPGPPATGAPAARELPAAPHT